MTCDFVRSGNTEVLSTDSYLNLHICFSKPFCTYVFRSSVRCGKKVGRVNLPRLLQKITLLTQWQWFLKLCNEMHCHFLSDISVSKRLVSQLGKHILVFVYFENALKNHLFSVFVLTCQQCMEHLEYHANVRMVAFPYH